jgi:rubredoxin
VTKRTFECFECGNVWRVLHGQPRPAVCPECSGEDIRVAPEDRSQGRDRSHLREQRRESRLVDDE